MTSPPTPAQPISDGLARLHAGMDGPPDPPTRALERRRLVDRAAEALDRRLLLVVAPGGFGKTQLLAAACARRAAGGRLTAWLGLATGDNDPIRFLATVVRAIERAAPGVVDAAKLALSTSAPPPIEAVVLLLAAGLRDGPPISLVLDDYHLIRASTVHQALLFLLDRAPSTLRLAIAARANPPLPVSRWRARGELADIRQADLALTADESASYVRDVLDRRLSGAELAELHERVEGRLIALALADGVLGSATPAALIAGLRATPRRPIEHLVEATLASLDVRSRAAVLALAVPSHLDGAVARTLAGEDALALLARARLPVETWSPPRPTGGTGGPTTGDRAATVTRIHPSVARVLKQILQRHEPDRLIALEAATARALAAAGAPLAAVEHASMAEDAALAAELIERSAPGCFMRGETATLRRWLAPMPEDVVAHRPELNLLYARLLLPTGQIDGAEQLVAQARPLIGEPSTTIAPGRVESMRAAIALTRGDALRAADLASAALRLLPATDRFWRPGSGLVLGEAERALGDVAAASRAYAAAADQLIGTGDLNQAISARTLEAACVEESGRLTEAARLFEAALAVASGATVVPAAGPAYAGLARIAYARDDLAAAERLADLAVARSRLGVSAQALPLSCAIQARVRRALGDAAGAAESLALADHLLARAGPAVRGAVESERIQLWLAAGEVDLAVAWARRVGRDEQVDHAGWDLLRTLGVARVLLACGEPAAALVSLAPLNELAEEAEQIGYVVESLTLAAAAHQRAGDAEDAGAALDRALALAAPERHRRVFVDLGEWIGPVLERRPDVPRTGDLATSAPAGFIESLRAALAGRPPNGMPAARRRPAAIDRGTAS